MNSYKPQDLANIVWAYATADEQHTVLFNKIGDAIVEKDRLESFIPQNFANIVWAYAKANEHHTGLFKKISDDIVEMNRLPLLSPQDLANIAWAYAIFNCDSSLMRGTAFREELVARQNEFNTEELTQLYRWHLWQTKEQSNDGLPESLQNKCKHVFLSADTRS
eukprot:scaffold346563_cov126-Cyclotella_meneghiniana.AAC.1